MAMPTSPSRLDPPRVAILPTNSPHFFGPFQNHPPGLSIQLTAHGCSALVDEALELMGRTVEGVGPFSWRRMDRFPAHLLFELVQAQRGLSSDRIANDGGNFIDAPVQPIRHIQTREKIFQVRAINAPELLHGHDAFEEPVFPDPRMPDARSFLFGPGGDPESAPR